MNKKPIWALTGLAVAAVAIVAGLTKDKWLAGTPQPLTGVEVSKTEEPVVPAANPSQQTVVEKTRDPEQQAAAEQPEAQPAQQAVAEQPEAQPEQQAVAEQPAPDTEQQAVAEQPEAQPAQQAVAEQPEAQPEQQAVAEQPAPDTEQQAAAGRTEPAEEQQQAVSDKDSKTDNQAEADKVPAFDTVRVEKTGEAVIAGTAEPEADVTVKLDGKEIGKTKANKDGAFVVVPDNPLPEGSGALTIEAKGQGDISPAVSEQVVAVIVPAQASKQHALVAVVSPGEPTRVLQKPAAQEAPAEEQQVAAVQPDAPATPETAAPAKAPQPETPKVETPKPAAKTQRLVSLDAVDYDASGGIVFSGRGEPGLGARIYVDNHYLGDASIDGDGRWLFTGTANIEPGVHSLRVDGIDASGKVLNRVEVPFFREETSKVATAAVEPEAPTVPETPAAAETPAEPEASAASDAVAEPSAEAPAESEVAVASTPDAAAEAGSEAEAQARGVPKDGRIVIQPGNNLWRISKVLYGSGEKFTVIYEANKGQIRDPDLIYPGQVFMTPDVLPPTESIDPKLRKPLNPDAGAATGQ